MQEVRLLAKLRHAGIACLYDAGTLPDGTPWFAMEYVDGQSFAAYSSNLNSLKDLLQLFCAVCEAVQHAHGKGIIHRDLKPSNLLVESNGTPKLLDFGIASELDRASSPSGLTALGMRFASPPYSAPEYVQDGTATAMSDVYSLGVMLYERLTGDSLTTSESVTSNANDAITECRPSLAARSSLNSHSMDRAAFTTSWQGALAKITRSEWNDLDVLCLKATHHDPARRYPSVEALARDVQHFLRQEPLEARPDTWTYRSAKFLRRNTFAVVSAIATLCVLLAMATVFTVRLARARTEALAQAERATRVQQFMLGLFANSGKPTDAPGNLTVETLLDRGAVEVETLHQNPALQADLNRMLGDMYSDLGKPAKAETGYAQALTFAESQPGTSIASLVDLRLQLAKVFTHENKIPQAHELGRVHTIG
jgi:serine/threonine-protein kinase